MKKKLSQEDVDRILELMDDLIAVPRGKALAIVDEVRKYLAEHDFSENYTIEIKILLGLARYYINDRDTKRANDVLQGALNLAEKK